MTEKQLSLFKDEPQGVKVEKAKSKAEIYMDYESFVSKFKDTPKTTDDCFTPQNIYEAVVDFVQRRAETPFTRILRPFYPGGDYEKAMERAVATERAMKGKVTRWELSEREKRIVAQLGK